MKIATGVFVQGRVLGILAGQVRFLFLFLIQLKYKIFNLKKNEFQTHELLNMSNFNFNFNLFLLKKKIRLLVQIDQK